MRFVLVGLLAASLGVVLALEPKAREEKEQQMRKIALEEVCRTIVEAKLVRSCSIQK